MNWNRVMIFSILCGIVSLTMMWLSGVGPVAAVVAVVSLSIGYAYGTFLMMHTYKKQVEEALKSIKEK